MAAISYVSTTTHLSFSKNDVLVCDASDNAIKAGMTSAAALRNIFHDGAKIYSFEGLHAKTLIVDSKVVIGSANLSENAGIKTCEASLLSDDQQIRTLVRGFIEQALKNSKPVDKLFLKRIEAIPVMRVEKCPERNLRQLNVGISKLWLVSTGKLSERIVAAEASAEKRGQDQANKKLMNGDYKTEYIRWAGTSRFRSEAQAGHLVIEVYQKRRGCRIEVYRAAPIIHKQNHGKWTRFWLERPLHENVYYSWSEFKADLERLGFKNISPKSTRELTKRASQVLACLE